MSKSSHIIEARYLAWKRIDLHNQGFGSFSASGGEKSAHARDVQARSTTIFIPSTTSCLDLLLWLPRTMRTTTGW